DGVAVTRVRAAISAVHDSGDRCFLEGAAADRPDPESGSRDRTSGGDALSTWTAVGSSIPTPGRERVRGAVGIGAAHRGLRLRAESDRHVRGNRLGGGPPIFTPTPAATSFRLARLSRSGRDSGHDAGGDPLQSRVPTEHLHGFEFSSGIAFVRKGGFDGCESRKNRVIPLWPDCDAGFGEA